MCLNLNVLDNIFATNQLNAGNHCKLNGKMYFKFSKKYSNKK